MSKRMKVAVFRHGLPLNTGGESEVGGGAITSAILRTLAAMADVTVTGAVNKRAVEAVLELGLGIEPTEDLSRFDRVFVLTGPSNPLYDGWGYTYRALATAKCVPTYLQWDVALPLALDPKGKKSEPPLPSIAALCVVSQVRGRFLHRSAYDLKRTSFDYCFFEAIEADQAVLPSAKDGEVAPRFAYLGSDRPGRLTEFMAYFGRPDSPPVDVYGRWSKRNVESLAAHPNVTFKGPVPERQVRHVLNGYASAIHIVDSRYVDTNFVAQRFFEQTWAGVPVAYAARMQLDVAKALALHDGWVLRKGSTSAARWLERVVGMSREQRDDLIHEQATMCRRLIAERGMDTIRTYFEKELLA